MTLTLNWPRRWTKVKPTAPGWYWYRENTQDCPHVIEIVDVCDELQTMHDTFDFKVSELHGEWAGPITPPEEGP